MALKREARSVSGHQSRLLVFADSMVSVLAFDKGRSKSYPLNSLCRRAAAYQIACGIKLRCRHIPTDRNVADEGSRRRRYKGPQNFPKKKDTCMVTPNTETRSSVYSDLCDFNSCVFFRMLSRLLRRMKCSPIVLVLIVLSCVWLVWCPTGS